MKNKFIKFEAFILNIIHFIKRKFCKTVICDTNVWYRLANGRIKWWQVIKYNLVFTQVSIDELHSTEVIYKNPDLFLAVARAVRIHASKAILVDPFAYVYFRNKGADNVFHDKLMENYKTLIGIRKTELWMWNDTNALERLKQKIKSWNKPTEDLCDQINTITVPQLKSRAKSLGKKEIDKEDLQVVTATFVFDVIKERYSDGVEIGRNININNIGLFMDVFELYLKNLSKVPNSKIQYNDLNDLINLLYATQDMHYWTYDDVWKEYIMKGEKSKKYSVSQPSSL